MKMLSDYDLFKQLCDKQQIAVLPDILEAMKSANSSGELRLPCQSIIFPVCAILGRVLASSTAIRSVDLSDCMLISRGLSKILEAFSAGSNVVFLNLKGNNISGAVVSHLGEIFHRNNTLKRLNIEWNSLGTDGECFERFCEGLASNSSIEELDLRYNQISQVNCNALSKAIVRNKSIKVLNLGRNNLGTSGGRAILSALRDNSSLTNLNLRGNCVPQEILTIIEDLTLKNQRRAHAPNAHRQRRIFHDNRKGNSSSSEDNVRENVISRKKKKRIPGWKGESTPVKKIVDFQDVSMMSLNVVGEISQAVESGNVPMEHLGKEAADVSSKIGELNRILQERTAVINKLVHEAAEKDTEVEKMRKVRETAEEDMQVLKVENEKILGDKERLLESAREAQRLQEDNWRREKRELEDIHNEAKIKIKELEAQVKKYEGDLQKNSLAMVNLREKVHVKSHQYEEIVSNVKTEIHRLRGELKERVNKHKIEITVLKSTLKETTDALVDCQTQLQKSRVELRDVSDSFSFVKSQVKELEAVAVKHLRLEETFQKLKEDKLSLDEKYIDSQRTIASLKRQKATLENELVEPQRRLNLLKEDLAIETEKSARLKQELLEERTRLKERECHLEKTSQQITSLNSQISEIQRIHTEEMREKDREKKILTELVASKERDLNDLRAKEAQRAGQLYAAFTKYLGSMESNTL